MLSIDDDIPRSCFGNASDSRSNAHLGTRIMRQAYTELGEHPLYEARAIPAGRSIASRHIRIALELQSIVGQCLTSGTRRSRRNATDVGTFGRTAGSLSFSLRLRLSLRLSRLCLSLSFSLSLLLSLSVLFRLRLGLGNIQTFDATPIGVGLNIRGCVLGEKITLGRGGLRERTCSGYRGISHSTVCACGRNCRTQRGRHSNNGEDTRETFSNIHRV